MEILEIQPQGFCGGVRQALRKVRDLSEAPRPEPVTILGALVHNDYISRALEEKGIRTIETHGMSREEMLDQVESGTVVFTAHGVSDAVVEKARNKGLHIVDASCPFVLKTKELVKQKSAMGATILYAGKKGHPEAEAVCTSAPNVILIETLADIPTDLSGPVFVTNQTTMSILDVQHLFDEIKRLYPQAEIHDEICNATRVRQQALLALKDQGIDALIVVGDPSSNNTRQLEAIGKLAGIPLVLRVETAADLDLSLLPKDGRVAVTSGASTPKALEQQVVETLRSMDAPKEIRMEDMLEV